MRIQRILSYKIWCILLILVAFLPVNAWSQCCTQCTLQSPLTITDRNVTFIAAQQILMLPGFSVTIEGSGSFMASVQPCDVSETRLDVPYKSQLDASCISNNLCGYASTLMLTSYLHGSTPTTDMMQDMAEYAYGSRCPSGFSGMNQFLAAARAAHLGNAPNSYEAYVSFDQLKTLLRNCTPVMVILQYSGLAGYRCYTDFGGGHAMVVAGFSESRGSWILHDPYCRSNGAYREIPHANFQAATQAMSGNSVWIMVAQ